MTKTSPRGKEWSPRGNVAFQPVPYVLLHVVKKGDSEYASADQFGSEWVPFDPWHKGDLVAVEIKSSYHHQGKGRVEYSNWRIGRRANTPAAEHTAIDLGGVVPLMLSGPRKSNAELLRIAYRYHSAAARLIGQDFESRSALESALENPAAKTAAAETSESIFA